MIDSFPCCSWYTWLFVALMALAVIEPAMAGNSAKEKLDAALTKIRTSGVHDHELVRDIPLPELIEIVQPALKDPFDQIRSFAVSALLAAVEGSEDLRTRQRGVNLVLDVVFEVSDEGEALAAAHALIRRYATEFDEQAAAKVLKLLASDTPSPEIVLLAGVVGTEPLRQRLEQLKALQPPPNSHGVYSLAYPIDMALARMGSKQALASVLERINAQPNPEERSRRFPDAAYVRQPEAVELLKANLMSKERCKDNNGVPGRGLPIARFAAHALAGSIEGFPLGDLNIGLYGDKEIQTARAWMQAHPSPPFRKMVVSRPAPRPRAPAQPTRPVLLAGEQLQRAQPSEVLESLDRSMWKEIHAAWEQTAATQPQDSTATADVLAQTAAVRRRIADLVDRRELILPKPQHLGSLMQYISGGRDAVHLFLIEAREIPMTDEAAGDAIEAAYRHAILTARSMASCDAIQGLGAALAWERDVLEQLVSQSAACKWPAAQLDRVRAVLEPLGPPIYDAARALDSHVEMLERSFTSQPVKDQVIRAGFPREDVEGMDTARLEKMHQTKAAQQSWLQVDQPRAPRLAEPVSEDRIVNSWMPKLGRAVVRKRVAMARYNATMAALRVLSKARSSGKIPSREEVFADDAARKLTDPFTGGPLGFVRTDDGVIIYSVGPDQMDGQGKTDVGAEPGDWASPAAGDVIVAIKIVPSTDEEPATGAVLRFARQKSSRTEQ